MKRPILFLAALLFLSEPIILVACQPSFDVPAALDAERARCEQNYARIWTEATSLEQGKHDLDTEHDRCRVALEDICRRGGGRDCE